MPMNREPLLGAPPDVVRRREEEKEHTIILLAMIVASLIFAPFLIVAPLIVMYIYRKDRKDFVNPHERRVLKDRLWSLMFIPLSFTVFYFLFFPLIPISMPVWGLWAKIVLIHDLLINMLLCAVFTGLEIFATVKVRDYVKLKYHPYRDLLDSDDYLILPTRTHGTLILRGINTGIMVLGATGSGKTEFIKQMVAQFPDDVENAFVVFDPNGDYYREFGSEEDIVLSIKGREATHSWNIFREIAPRDPLKHEEELEDLVERAVEVRNAELSQFIENIERGKIDTTLLNSRVDLLLEGLPRDLSGGIQEEENPFIAISQIMGELFKEMSEGSQDKFWNYAAQQVLEGVIYMMYKEAVRSYEAAYEIYEKEHEAWEKSGKRGEEPESPDFYEFLPTNADLYYKLTRSTFQDVYAEMIKHPELKMIADYINPKVEKMAGSVWAVLGTQVKRIFQGTFGPQSVNYKQISMKEYMLNPRGRKLFIEYGVEEGEVTGPIYRLLIDRLIEYAFAKSRKKYRKFFLIDEFHLVPKLNLYQALVNYGRQHKITSVIGVQSITQMVSTYGKEVTNSVISGHRFIIGFSVTDEESKNVLEQRLGSKEIWQMRPVQISSYTGRGSYQAGAEYQRLQYKPLDLGDIARWLPGEALILERRGFKKVRFFTHKDGIRRINKVREEIRQLRRKLWEKEQKKRKR